MADNDHNAKLKGSPGTCARCGMHRHEHSGSLLRCLGGRYGFFSAKFDSGGELLHEYTSRPICPWCGRDVDVGDDPYLYDEGTHEFECGSCERPFEINTMVTIAYTTERMPVEEDDDK